MGANAPKLFVIVPPGEPPILPVHVLNSKRIGENRRAIPRVALEVDRHVDVKETLPVCDVLRRPVASGSE